MYRRLVWARKTVSLIGMERVQQFKVGGFNFIFSLKSTSKRFSVILCLSNALVSFLSFWGPLSGCYFLYQIQRVTCQSVIKTSHINTDFHFLIYLRIIKILYFEWLCGRLKLHTCTYSGRFTATTQNFLMSPGMVMHSPILNVNHIINFAKSEILSMHSGDFLELALLLIESVWYRYDVLQHLFLS